MKEDIDRLLSGLNTFPEGLFMWNCDDSTMAYVNQGFQQITGYDYDDVVHVPVNDETRGVDIDMRTGRCV